MATDIILDPRIRDWVLLPLTLIMVFMGLGRHYVTMLMDKRRKQDKENVKDMMMLRRGQILMGNCYYLPRAVFHARKQYYNDPKVGIFKTREDTPPDPMKNPMMSGALNTRPALAFPPYPAHIPLTPGPRPLARRVDLTNAPRAPRRLPTSEDPNMMMVSPVQPAPLLPPASKQPITPKTLTTAPLCAGHDGQEHDNDRPEPHHGKRTGINFHCLSVCVSLPFNA